MMSGRKRLREWIGRSKLNQREAADLLGITDVYLSQILCGERTPARENAILIEDVTGVSVRSWSLSDLSNADAEQVGAGGKRKQTKR